MADRKELKVTFIGAGSPIWTGRICADLAGTAEFGRAELCLHDNVVPIISALAGHGEYTGVMNMPNVGQMPDLPLGAVVETQCRVDCGGIQPLASGPLPAPVHTLVAGHIERYEMSVEAAVTGDAALAVAALASDPQLLGPISAKPMVHEMLEQSRQWLAQF